MGAAEPAARPAYCWRARSPMFWLDDGEGMPPREARRHTDAYGGADQREVRSL
jgi:hypothetical protein